MSALQRLQEKIEQLKSNYIGMKEEIVQLKSQLEGVNDNQGAQENIIRQLRDELEEKDREIEEVVAKVEELLA